MGILEGKVAVITGSSRGLGLSIAKAYAAEGASIVIASRTPKAVSRAVEDLRNAGHRAEGLACDASDMDQVEALANLAVDRFGKLDIWVANAGILRELTPVSHSKMKDWHDTMTVNVMANVQMIRTLEPLLKTSDAGRAIFVGSYLGEHPTAYFGAYGVSKAAITHLALTWAAETKQSQLRINVVEPGAVDTDMLTTAFPGGYQGDDLHTPTQVAPLFLELALSSCARHGEIVRKERVFSKTENN